MSVFYALGFALGVMIAWMLMAVPFLLVIPCVRRAFIRDVLAVLRAVALPLLRRVTGRQPERVAERTAELEQELECQPVPDGRGGFYFVPPPGSMSLIRVRGTLSFQNVEQIKRKFEEAARSGRPPVILPPDVPPSGPPMTSLPPAGMPPQRR